MSDLLSKLQAIRRDLREEYLEAHAWPWIIGFSGGKDSTLILHLVVECLKTVPPDERRRPVFIVCNDTLVESPVFHAFTGRLLEQIEDGIAGFNIPVTVIRTAPLPEESFWVNLLGRGYPAPNRSFRWCTDRMKIRPTSRFIREQVSYSGNAVLLLGVRRDESSQRAQSVAKYHDHLESRPSVHNDHPGCFIFAPIRDITTEEVWACLIAARPPWGGSYRDLVALYKEAAGNECPFVLSKADAPGCGTNSARFGCWTCTVVDKDRSLDSLIAGDHPHLEPRTSLRFPPTPQTSLQRPRLPQQNPPERSARSRPSHHGHPQNPARRTSRYSGNHRRTSHLRPRSQAHPGTVGSG